MEQQTSPQKSGARKREAYEMPNKCPNCGKRIKYQFCRCLSDVEEETTTELDLNQENILNEEVHIINEPIDENRKTDFAIKRKIREEPNESNVKDLTKNYIRFMCVTCSKQFNSFQYLKRHIGLMHSKCKFCQKIFANVVEMNDHIVKCHGHLWARLPLKPRNSEEVPIEIKDSVLDFNKISSTHKEAKNQCQLCSKQFNSFQYLQTHIVKVHGVKRIKQVLKPRNSEILIESESGAKNQSQFCPAKFAKGSDMSAHVTSVLEMKCQFCPSHFLTQKDLDEHITTCNEMPILTIPLFDKKGYGSMGRLKTAKTVFDESAKGDNPDSIEVKEGKINSDKDSEINSDKDSEIKSDNSESESDNEEKRLQNIAEVKKLFKARKDLKLPLNDYERKRALNIRDMAEEKKKFKDDLKASKQALKQALKKKSQAPEPESKQTVLKCHLCSRIYKQHGALLRHKRVVHINTQRGPKRPSRSAVLPKRLANQVLKYVPKKVYKKNDFSVTNTKQRSEVAKKNDIDFSLRFRRCVEKKCFSFFLFFFEKTFFD